MSQLAGERISPSFSDRCKRLLLGKPMINDQLQHERLSNPVALGRAVLRLDLLDRVRQRADHDRTASGCRHGRIRIVASGHRCHLVHPRARGEPPTARSCITYTRSGGSYVVARDNFGPRVAQVAAAALLIDYVVTVAVQCAAGTVAVASMIPALGPYSLEITVTVVLLMCFANLRGLREAGRPFAVPTYFFASMVIADDRGRRYPRASRESGHIRRRAHPWDGATSSRQWPDHGCDAADRAAGIRQRWFVAHRGRSDLQHRQQLP